MRNKVNFKRKPAICRQLQVAIFFALNREIYFTLRQHLEIHTREKAGTWLLVYFHQYHDDNHDENVDDNGDDNDDDNDDDDEKANVTIEGAVAGSCPVVGGWHAVVI